jgi:aerobic carbon-monoxide dehydrogenase large subunit
VTTTEVRPPDTGTGVSPQVGIGSAIERVESERLVIGEGRFVDDRNLPGMLHVAFVRSTVPHADIVSIDIEAAAALPGVRMVVTPQDVIAGINPIDGKWPLVGDRTRYVGEPLAAVVADTRYIAEDAAELIRVSFAPLAAVADPVKGMQPGSAVIFERFADNVTYTRKIDTGGVDEAFAAAAAVVSIETQSARAAPAPMEPRSYAAAWHDGDQTLTLWTCSSSTFAIRNDVARSIGIPETHVRVEIGDVGGSFGAKNPVFEEEILVAWLARELRTPVKFTETRSEHMVMTHHGRDQRHSIRGAFDADGRILAIEDDIICDMGATEGRDNSVDSSMNYVPGPYVVAQYRVRARAVCTNKTPHGSLRGIGKADATWAIERLMDHAARRLDLDKAEIRLRNYIPAEAFPYLTVTGALLDSGRYGDCLRKAMELAHYDDLLAERTELRKQGIHRGVGVALVVEPTSASRERSGGKGFATVRLSIAPSGQVMLFSGTSAQGQGHQTTMGQLVAGGLGIPMEDVTVYLGETHATPWGFTAASSRSATVLMSAVVRAAEKAVERMRHIAAHVWDVAEEQTSYVDGVVTAVDGRTMTLQEVMYIAHVRVDKLPEDVDAGFELTGSFRNPNIDFQPKADGLYNAFASYPYDATVAVVDVDIDTGRLIIQKYVTVHDCGVAINPNIVDTQHIGSTIQGLGLALLEEIEYDDEAQPMTSSFMDYLLPSANELPREWVIDHIVTPSPFTAYGGKGAGETGTLSAPVVLASAIEDAIGPPFPSLTRMPMTPERIFDAITESRRPSDLGETVR